MDIYGGVGGLNVKLPTTDKYSPATKEAVSAASGGAIDIPQYDVAEGFAQTEDYYGLLSDYQRFMSEARARGIDPTIPRINDEESQLAYQLNNEFINSINRKGRQLQQAKQMQNQLMQGGYRMPIGDRLETGADVVSFMQRAPSAMKRGQLFPETQSYLKAISSDRIQPQQVGEYEANRERLKEAINAKREQLSTQYSPQEVDAMIAENLAAIDIPIPVRYPTEVELANLEMRRENLDWRKYVDSANLANKTQAQQDKINEAVNIAAEISTGGRVIPVDTRFVPSGQIDSYAGVDFRNTQTFRGLTTTKSLDKDVNEKLKANRSNSATNFSRIDMVPVDSKGRLVGSAAAADMLAKGTATLKPVLFGTTTLNLKDYNGKNYTESYEVFEVIEPSQLSKVTTGMSETDKKVYRILLEKIIDEAKGGTTQEPTTAPTEAKTVPIATIKGLVGKKGYEGYTEKELIDYYKSQGYTIQ